MPDRPIIGDDAALYLLHVAGHGLHEDTGWLIDVGRFPVGCRVLDVGCGTGTLVAALAGDKHFARSVIGVELSPELADHARRAVDCANGTVVQADFLTWTPPADWQADTLVMSYFLHHSDDLGPHLRRAAALLPHGGRLYVLDRLALDQPALDAFPQFWEEHYRADHEWYEEMPRLTTVSGLTDAAREAGFDFVRRQVCPHDHRAGAEGFPKTMMEFWRHESGRAFPAVLVVSPAHLAVVDEIVQQLASMGLQVIGRCRVAYCNALIRTIYERCPWREPYLRFVDERYPERNATALPIAGDSTMPELLDRLVQFKKTHRRRWQEIKGPVISDSVKVIVLPFHVPEPYESEALARVVRLPAGGL
jgi:SAM-dependent methyltransferase